jgi:hypothetical protein
MPAYQLPHSCETEEIAALLNQLSPRQQRVLRAYVWQVELGELLVSEWLATEGCPVGIKSWYRRGDNAAYWNDGAFRAALDAYLRTGQRWRLNQEQRQVERARTTLIQAAGKAANKLAGLVDSESERIALEASNSVLDRAGLETATKGTVDVQESGADDARAKLAKLLAGRAGPGADPAGAGGADGS